MTLLTAVSSAPATGQDTSSDPPANTGSDSQKAMLLTSLPAASTTGQDTSSDPPANTGSGGQEGLRPASGGVSVADYHQILAGLDYSRIPPVSELAVYELFPSPIEPDFPGIDDFMLDWGENLRSEFHLDGRHRHVSVSDDGICTIRQDGTPACWIQREQASPHWQNLLDEFDFDFNRATLSEERFTEIQLVASRDEEIARFSKLFACALSVSGAIRCWGSSDDGELYVPDNRYQQLEVGGRYVCGLTVQREAVCWGAIEGNFSKDAIQRLFSDSYFSVGKLRNLRVASRNCGLTTGLDVTCWRRYWDSPSRYFIDDQWGYESGWRYRGSGDHLYYREDRDYNDNESLYRRDLSYGFDGGVFYQDVINGNGVCGLEFSGAVSCLEEYMGWQDRSSMHTSFGHRSRYLEDRLVGREDFERLALFGRREGPYRSALLGAVYRCGILENGGLECWGGSRSGTAIAPEGSFTQISKDGDYNAGAGYATVCGVRDDLRVVCWGWLLPEWREDPPEGIRVLSVDEEWDR